MKKSIRIIAFSLVIISIFTLVACSNSNKNFTYWNDCSAINQLKEYVKDVTNKNSKNYIPVEDRIAVFDMDGTLYGELFPVYLEYCLLVYRCLDDPTYNEADEQMKTVAQNIRDKGVSGTTPLEHAYAQAKAFAGMTIDEFDKYMQEFLKKPCAGFNGMTYGEAFYLPMVEVFSYLQDNGFTTYVVSGSDRFICRSLVCKKLNISESQVIGMDVMLASSNQGETDGLDYQFKSGDKVVRTDELIIKNLKMNKVKQIMQEIGKQPVLSFGNSSGDSSMHMFTISNNKYLSKAFMLVADDETRDYGNTEKGNSLAETWKESGFTVISMKNDFKTIYGYNFEITK